jgi:hypothetical protein
MQQTTQQELERVIASKVKPGTSAEEVLDFLDSQQLDHTSLEALAEYDSDSRFYPVGTLMIRAIKRHTASGMFGFESLKITFVFTENHKLARFDVRPGYTAP